MKILLINHYAGSNKMGMEFRPYYLAKELIKLGHEVHIVSSSYSHLRQINPNCENWLYTEIIDKIFYHWINNFKYNSNGIMRAINMFWFVFILILKSKQIARVIQPDVVICSSTYPLDTFPGFLIKKYSTCKKPLLIHEIHDMWPLSPMEIGNMSKWHPFIWLMQLGEDFFCKNADKVVSLLPNSKVYLIQHGMDSNKFCYIPNGVVLEDWKSDNIEPLPLQHTELLNRLKKQGKCILGFFGSHLRQNGLELLINAVRKINSEKLSVVFVGSGKDKQTLIDMAFDLCDKIYFLPTISKKSIPSLLQMIDFSYIGTPNLPILRFGICQNKLFNSMMGAIPIIIPVKAPNDISSMYNCGVSSEGGNVDSLVDAIKYLMNLSNDERVKLGNNGRNAVLKYFNYNSIAKHFNELFNCDRKD